MFLSQIDVLSHSPSLPLSLKSVSMSSGEDKKKSDAVPFDPAAFREGSPGISIEYQTIVTALFVTGNVTPK